MKDDEVRVGILTVSDRCSSGETVDTSGDSLEKAVKELLGWTVTKRDCVPDDEAEIRRVLIDWSDTEKLNLVLTTGGTGISPRDVTPEATKSVINREVPGLVHRMMSLSLEVTPLAMLSRLMAGTRKRTLIVNFPGSRKASRECLDFLVPALPHAVDLLQDRKEKISESHNKLQGCRCHDESQGKNVAGVAGRPRQSPYPMVSVDEAQETVLRECQALEKIDHKKYEDALGKILAEDIFAKDDLPPFPASIKDGYAVISSDGKGLRKVIGNSDAGNEPEMATTVITSGTCIRINTGAPVPEGADAVVQVEDTELIRSSPDGKEELEIEILVEPKPGQDIRPVGLDIKNGAKVLSKGCFLGPPEMGILASVGVVNVPIFETPTVSLLSTGNELQDPTCGITDLLPGHIRDSNKTTLLTLLKEQGIPTIDCGIARDERKMLVSRLRTALFAGDIVVTTGGVSMGDKDLLRQVLISDFGAKIHFARVEMKPGKPTTFATVDWPPPNSSPDSAKKIILGLPGNPVSATVTSHLYVLPAIRKMAGHRRPLPALVKGILPETVKLDARPEYQRVILSWNGSHAEADITLTGSQISSRLLSFAEGANGLMILPKRTKDQAQLIAGTIIDVLVIGPLRAPRIYC